MTARLYRCQSCGTLMARRLLVTTTPLDGAQPLLVCKYRTACFARNEAHIADMLRRTP